MNQFIKQRLYTTLAILLLLTIHILGLFIDVTRDGAKYAYISKEIIETGNWFSLHIQSEPYLQKPQLLFWISAFSFKIFGVSNWSFKLPILLVAFAGYFAIYKLGKLLHNKKTGIYAASMMGFSVISVLYTMDIHTDIVLQTVVAFSLWMLFAFIKSNKLIYALGAGVSLGLCLLTKGPFGVLVPTFATLGYLITNSKLKSLINHKWLILVILSLIVAFPAFWAHYIKNGINGLWFFIWHNNAGRITGKYLGITTDPTFYLHNLLYLFIPWTIFLFSSSYKQFSDLFRKKMNRNSSFIFWGTWVAFLILSISMSKLPNYIQSIMPLLAISTAAFYIEKIEVQQSKKFISAQNILINCCWILIIALTLLFSNTSTFFNWFILIVLLIFSSLISATINYNKLFYRSIFVFLALSFLLNGHLVPMLFSFQSQPKAATIINGEIIKNEKVFNFLMDENKRHKVLLTEEKPDSLFDFDITPNEKHFLKNYELMFYCNTAIVHIESNDQMIYYINNYDGWIFTDENGYNFINTLNKNTTNTFQFDHLNLRRSGKFFTPWTRRSAIEKRYLIRFKRDTIYN